jgi:hypothetical protein
MSNTRKLSRSDNRDRERRHMAFLNRGDNGDMFATQARTQYAKHGRGFWITSDGVNRESAGTALYYIPIGDIGVFPEGRSRDVVTRLVQAYDPARQAIFVVEEDGTISSYKVWLIRRAAPGLN